MAAKKSPGVNPAEESRGIVLTAEQKRRLRARNIAIAVVLVGLVALFYLITIFKIGGNIADRAI